MQMFIKTLCALSGLMAASTALSAQTWNMATAFPDSTYHTQNIRWFAGKVEGATNGELKIAVHSGASMFKLPEIKRALRTGQVPIAELTLNSLGNENALFEADTVPFLAVGVDQATRLYELQKPLLVKAFKKEGIIPLFSVIWPGNGLYINKEISRGADLNGEKLRGQIPIVSKMGEMMGATPVNVQFVEVPQAFSTGVITSMFSAASNGVDMQAWEYIRHFYNLSAYHPRNLVAVNESAWKALSPDTQKKVLAIAKQAEERGWKRAVELQNDSINILAKHGMKVHEPSPELMADFEKVGGQLIADWAKRTGPDGAVILKEMTAFKQKNK